MVTGLGAAGYRVHTLVEQDAVGRLATVRMSGPPGDGAGIVVDLLLADYLR